MEKKHMNSYSPYCVIALERSDMIEYHQKIPDTFRLRCWVVIFPATCQKRKCTSSFISPFLLFILFLHKSDVTREPCGNWGFIAS